MRYDDFRRSDNIEDRRDGGGDDGGGFFPGGGGGGGFPVGQGGLGIGTIVVLGILGWALGIDPRILIGGAEIINGGGAPSYQTDMNRSSRSADRQARTGTPTDETGAFVAGVLGEIEDRWTEIFKEQNMTYRAPRLILFRGATRAGACGQAQSAMGPFYCPPDQRIYLDTGFFKEIEGRFRGCSGNACKFTQAYIIAHESGHHIQNLLGIIDKVAQAQQASGSKAASNRLQVMVELQADCFAGVWANREKQKRTNYLEEGDIDAALQTAAAIGDDTLQRKAQGRVVPDSFTHGSAEQRKRWFTIGFQQGKVSACNTFQASNL